MIEFDVKPVMIASVRADEPDSDVPCGTCTRCCEMLAPYLTPEEISSGLYPLSFTNPTPEQQRMAPRVDAVITLFRRPTGGCGMFVDGRCTIYDHRPQACRQFDCRKGHHPSLVDHAREKFGK